MEWIFEFFKKLKQVLTDEVIQRIDTRKGVSQGINSGVSLRLKRARGSGELYVVMRSVIGDYNDHHFTKHEFIQFSNAVETILNSLKHGDYAGARPLYERALAINEKAHSRRPTFPSSSSSAASFLLRL